MLTVAATTIPTTTMTQRAFQTAFIALAARVRVTLRSASRSRHIRPYQPASRATMTATAAASRVTV
jgi:hypothetical protein